MEKAIRDFVWRFYPDEDLVKGKGTVEFPQFPPFRVLRHPERYFTSGIMGDPSQASAEVGKRINGIIAKKLTELIRGMLAEPEGSDL